MSEYDPALWDTRLKADAELQDLQNLLAPYSVKARGLENWTPNRNPTKSRYAKFAKLVATGLAASLLLYMAHLYRLDWNEGQPWQASLMSIPDKTVTSLVITPGSLLETNLEQSLNIEVARIGHIALSPKSKLRLIETQATRHRVELESGHLRAIIWAPPGYFGVTHGTAELVDLGCDFDLWKNLDGSGRVYVRSGWISYRIGAYDVLVPAGYEMKFNAQRPFIPIRPNSNPDFSKSVHELELALTKSGASSAAAMSAAATVAETAQDADAFTLLSLLTEYPPLAKGELYPRLAIALNVSVNNEAHRAAWRAGNMHAMNSWWDAYPTQPKNWLANWTDLLN